MKIVKEPKENAKKQIHLFTNIRGHDILYHRKHKLYLDAVFRQSLYDVLDTLPYYYVEFKELELGIEIYPNSYRL